jgi:multidrug efflux pump subunit AcrB
MSIPNLSALAIRERALTLFLLLSLLVAGTYAFLAMGRAEDPTFTVRVMVVSVEWPGATPTELRDQVVDRLEQRIQEVTDLYRIETTIRPGRADLQIEFEDHIPSAQVPDRFYQVRRRMQDEAPRLPEGVIGPLINEDFSDVYFSLIGLTAPGLQHRELIPIAERLRDRLQRLEGSSTVRLIGERQAQIHLDLDMPRLLRLGISPEAVHAAIVSHNRLLPLGRLDTGGPRLQLRVARELNDPDLLAALPIRVGDQTLTLGDLANIRRGYEDPPRFLVRAHGEDALLLGVVMRAGENGLSYGRRLSDFLEREQRALPEGVVLRQLTNQAEAIGEAVSLFQIKFLIAVAVVMAVTVLAIGMRAGLVVGIAIPITLAITFLVMLLTGINLDRITLGALIIALGLLVDDAIIAIEMMIVKMENGWDRVRAAAHAWSVTAAPMLFGTLVTAAGFVPIGFARSGVGEYAGNIFWVLAIALLASWVVAVTFTPYLGVKLLREPPPSGSAGHGLPYQSGTYRALRSVIRHCVRFRKTVLTLTVALLALSVVGMLGFVQQQFFPGSDRTEVLVSIQLPQGSAIGNTDALARQLEAALADDPALVSLSAYIGAGAPRFFISANPEQPDAAFARLIAVTTSPAERDRIMRDLRQRIADGEFPGARIRVEQLLYGPPVSWPVSFRVVAEDPTALRPLAHAVRELVAAHPDTRLVHLDVDERAAVLRFKVDDQRLRRLGLTRESLASQLHTQLDGRTVTLLREDNRQVPLIARPASIDREHLEVLELYSEDGARVLLGQLGHFEVDFEEPVLRRIDRRALINVHADVEGAQANDVTAALWAELQALRATLPPDRDILLGGSVEQSERADASIQALQPVMLSLMLLFIMLQMRSFIGTFVVVVTAPLGLIGAVAALLLFQQPFGFVALLGLIGLAGILMRNTLILAQQVSDNLEAGLSPAEAIVEAAVQRARPVVLTALAAALAFVPLTFDSFWGPLAYVLIGGVTAGTAITLLFVPALYALWLGVGAMRAPTKPS